MDTLTLTLLLVIGAYLVNGQQQRKRMALLASHLGHYQIEKLMQALTEGYLRALGESTPERQEQIWKLLRTSEMQLAEQFKRFAADFSQVNEADARVSRLALPLPLAAIAFPWLTFDMRRALQIHAQGISQALAQSPQPSQRDRAFRISAELFLMQHTCHWFCKSRAMASARMMVRHQTPHEQLIDSVGPETRSAYLALIQGR